MADLKAPLHKAGVEVQKLAKRPANEPLPELHALGNHPLTGEVTGSLAGMGKFAARATHDGGVKPRGTATDAATKGNIDPVKRLPQGS
jgi:acyl-CoA-binding protein